MHGKKICNIPKCLMASLKTSFLGFPLILQDALVVLNNKTQIYSMYKDKAILFQKVTIPISSISFD